MVHSLIEKEMQILKKRRILKGFTLVELIVVIAVFGLLMAAAMAILGPVKGLYDSTYTYSNSVAVVDNVSMYLESNLRYANRIDICDEAYIKADDEENFRNAKITEFIGNYHLNDSNRVSQAVADEVVYLLKIDNPDPDSPGELVGLDTDTLNLKYKNDKPGRIQVWKYKAKDGSELKSEYKAWAVNELFYDDYSFTSVIDNTRDKDGAEILNFTLNINLFHNDRKGKGPDNIVQITNTKLDNVVSFPLINVVDTKGIIQDRIFVKNAITEEAEEIPGKDRYNYRNTYTTTDPSDSFVGKGTDIYITFTKCPEIGK